MVYSVDAKSTAAYRDPILFVSPSLKFLTVSVA